MKKMLLITASLLTGFLTFGQSFEEWSEPVMLTDSLSTNRNATVVAIAENNGGELFMFYEKQVDSSSPKEIWMRIISEPMSEEQQILADEIFDFRNPQVVGIFPDYFLLFETNNSGSFQLGAMKFTGEAVFGSPFQLTYETSGVDHCNFYHEFWSNQFMGCWQHAGKISYADLMFTADTVLIESSEVIDSVDCSNPVCFSNYCQWQKIISGESQIWHVSRNTSTNEWDTPDALFEEGNNINLKKGTSHSWFDYGISCWENSDTIVLYDGWDDEFYGQVSYGIDQYNEPHIFNFDLIVDFINIGYVTFTSGEDNDRDIFVSFPVYSWENINLSNNNVPDYHPYLFPGRTHSYWFELLDVWESEMNGSLVICKSDIAISYGGVAENSGTNRNISIGSQPNPFRDRTDISFVSEDNSKAEITIYDATGRIVIHETIKPEPGMNHFCWNPESDGINGSGMFLIRLRQGKKKGFCRIIKH